MTDSFEQLAAEIVSRVTDANHPDHVHRCALDDETNDGDEGHQGPCVCGCGAVLSMGPTYESDGRWVWKLTDGSIAPFPDPREKVGG